MQSGYGLGGLVLLAAACCCASGGLERGIIYVQPSYHYTNTLALRLPALRRDLDAIAAKGFDNVGLRVSWGEIMSHWDPATRTPTWNESNCKKLHAIAAEATQRGLRLIFNTHLKDTVPRGIEGAYFVKSRGPDLFNVTGGDGTGVWRSRYEDVMVRDSYREPMVLFHQKFASCFQATPTAPRFWKHAFESCYIFPQQLTPAALAAGAADAAVAKFGRWARAQNASLDHWRARWVEPGLASFAAVSLPNSTGTRPGQAAKFGDFWRFWLLGVLKDGTYGLSIAEILGGLRQGAGAAYEPELAFKHWRPSNLEGLTDLTTAELRSAFDLPINATALGYYVNDAAQLAQEPAAFKAYIASVQALAPPALPIIDWETGASTAFLSEAQQAQWARDMIAAAAATGIAGFNWWQYVDWAPVPSRPCTSRTNCELYHFGAHRLNGTAKPVWAEL